MGMAATRRRKLPNCYFVGPDGRIATSPDVDSELLRSPLVHQLLGQGSRMEAVPDEIRES